MLNKLLLGRLLFPADADAVLSGEKGPLHGLPFSVKDNCGIIGYDSTISISRFINQPATEDAAIVIALKIRFL